MKIITHHDPDGLISAYFTKFGTNAEKILVAEEFGETKNFDAGDIMTDMKPDNPNIEGLVIDHHPNHPEEKKYALVWRDYPASLIAYELFYDSIPEKERWKLVIGLGGDCALHLMPPEIIEQEKSLLLLKKSWAGKVYGKTKVSYFPIYKLLSSVINAYCRTHLYDKALKLIAEAKKPLDILEDEEGKKLHEKVSDEFEKILKSGKIFELGNLVIILFISDLRMSGYVASALSNDLNKTVIALNERTKSLSLRGDLSLYLRRKLEGKDYISLDGHAGAMGGKCIDSAKLLEDLSKIF